MKRIVAIFFLVIALASQANARTVTGTTHFLNVSFDASTEELPPNFSGHNVAGLFNKLEKIARTEAKGQFETTKEYEARKSEIESKPLLGLLRIQSVYAFNFNITNAPFSHTLAIYDADKGVMSIKLSAGHPPPFSIPKAGLVSVFPWSASDTSLGSSIRANAFGVAKKVESRWVKSFGVSFASNQDTPGVTDNSFETAIPMSVEEAKKAISSLAVLVVGHLSPPFVYTGGDAEDATLDHPREVTTEFHLVNMSIESVWVYNKKTGAVYKKVKLENQ